MSQSVATGPVERRRGTGKPARIAVVGAGVSGLVAAHELQRAGHDVHLFEAASYPGGHANTIRLRTESGAYGVDTGFVVLNDRNYPNLERLFDELGVATQPAEMSFSVSDGTGGFEWSSRPAGIFARPAHAFDPRFHRMLADLVRFNREAKELVGRNGGGPSLREFLEEHRYSPYFVERLIVPQVSAIWSADPAELWSFPASFMAEFFSNHCALQLLGRPRWRSVTGGSQRYVDAIVRGLSDRVHLGEAVRRIERDADGVTLLLDDSAEHFDQVALAVHSDQALAMLARPSRAEQEILGSIPYQSNDTVLHTDRRLLPRRRAARASWNFHLRSAAAGRTTITYDMSRLQALPGQDRFLVTLNRTEAIDPDQVIGRFNYAHPVFTRDGVAAQRRWAEISGAQRTHYCGAYWRWGFHEDGVWSGLRISEALGGRGPIAGEAAAAPPTPIPLTGGEAATEELPLAA